jgi:hypothetical protein
VANQARREWIAKRGLQALIIAFAVVVSFGFLVVSGAGPIALADLQTFLQGLDHPTPLTDMVHFLLGFGTAILTWVLVTTVPARRRGHSVYERIKVTGHSKERRVRMAVEGLVLYMGVAFLVIGLKEFTFDIWVEQASYTSGVLDFLLYLVGAGAGIGAAFVFE